jgi:hypothetical protein
MSFKIDATDPANLKSTALSERETRKRLLTHARLLGFEKDMLLLFAKADKQIRNCTNEKEKQDIGKMYSILIYKLLGGGGQLYIDGNLVCDDEPKNNENNLYIPQSSK